MTNWKHFISATNKLKVLGLYRNFKLTNHQTQTELIDELINELSDHNIVLGDTNFNFNKLVRQTYRFSNLYNKWHEATNLHNLHQVNHDNT